MPVAINPSDLQSKMHFKDCLAPLKLLVVAPVRQTENSPTLIKVNIAQPKED